MNIVIKHFRRQTQFRNFFPKHNHRPVYHHSRGQFNNTCRVHNETTTRLERRLIESERSFLYRNQSGIIWKLIWMAKVVVIRSTTPEKIGNTTATAANWKTQRRWKHEIDDSSHSIMATDGTWCCSKSIWFRCGRDSVHSVNHIVWFCMTSAQAMSAPKCNIALFADDVNIWRRSCCCCVVHVFICSEY